MTQAKPISPAVESLEQERRDQRAEGPRGEQKRLDEALKDSFPASDPVARSIPGKPGAPHHRKG